ncbi:MAG: M20 family metallopeptidase [Eubacterium sp.]
MENYLDTINTYIDENKKIMVELWKDLVTMESYSKEYDRVNALAEKLKLEFEKVGLECELIDSKGNAKTLVGTIGRERKGKPVLLCGHMDTVFPFGSFGETPFRIEDGKAFGPGVLDMKGGLVIALYVIKALNQIGYNERPLKIVFSGDEEIGHTNSNGADIILKQTQGGLCAFNLETGLPDNALCIGRKGNIDCHVNVTGMGAHVGNKFLDGKNAIEEMSYKVIELQKLTNLEEGIIVSVDIIKGGTVSNAIPATCQIEIDARFDRNDQINGIKQRILDICSKTFIEGTKTSVDFVNTIAPFETTEEVMNFYSFVNESAQKNHFEPMGYKRLGGNSDASYLGMSGTPVLCSFGVIGEWNHTKKEYAIVDSLFERSNLIASIILNLNEYKNQEI